MTFELKIQDPVVGEKLKVDFSWPANFKKTAHKEDADGARYVIIFFDPETGNPAGSDVLETNIVHYGSGTEHSVTAIGVQGNKVVHQDRKMVRDAQPHA